MGAISGIVVVTGVAGSDRSSDTYRKGEEEARGSACRPLIIV
jgi:hypothetical protein